jgi:hypothetical protein
MRTHEQNSVVYRSSTGTAFARKVTKADSSSPTTDANIRSKQFETLSQVPLAPQETKLFYIDNLNINF